MCRFCAEHNYGKKWFLNPENFKEDLLEDKWRMKIVSAISGWDLDFYVEWTSKWSSRAQWPIVGGPIKAALNSIAPLFHAGQVVKLEDALKIVELADKHVIMPCICRRMTGAKEEMNCIQFGPIKELFGRKKPEEKMEELTLDEIKDVIKRCAKKGYVQQVLYAKWPYPIALCNCDIKYCTSMKQRFVFGIASACLKGYEVCVVDTDRCDGCEGDPQCVSKCQFNALRWLPTDNKVVCDPNLCFGCGLCRLACPTGALSLKPREEVLAAKGTY